MKQNPLISIIIPVYNVEKYLNRCIYSIVNQTYSNVEIILVNDGSKDSSPLICDEWAKKELRIKVIHKKNGGLSDARNTGLRNASGDVISFIDSDDYIYHDMYKTMIGAMIDYNADLVVCGRNVVKDNLKTKKFCCGDTKIFTPSEALEELLLHRYVDEAAWDKLYRKELLVNLEFPLNEINEDIVIMPKIIQKANKIVHVGVALYNYCLNENSITRSNYTSKNSIIIKHMNDLNSFIKSQYPQLEKYVRIFNCNYSVSQLLILSNTINGKDNFIDDYNNYFNILKKNYFAFMKDNNTPIKKKIEATLLLFKVYNLVKKSKIS